MIGAHAVLVDLDGTLVDTLGANRAAYTAALAEQGVSVNPAAFDQVAHGRNWRQFLPELLAAAGSAAEPAVVAARKAALYGAMLDHSRVNTGLVRLLEAARGECRLALVTTASRGNAEAVLRHHGLDRLFEVVVTGDDVTCHKPAPDAYALAAERLGVAPGACVVVEDSDIGVAAGIAFGAAVLRVRMDA